MSKIKRLWLAAVLTLCAGATASAYDLTGQSGHGGLTFRVNGTTASTADEGQAVTVKVKPDAGWQTKTVTARAYDTWGAAKARGSSRSIDILTVTPTGSGNTWTFTMPGASVEVSAEYRKLLTHADITVGSIAAVTYNGKAHKPAVTVKDGSTLLTLGTDYTVSYSSNTNAGTANVTITGQGNYGGSVVKTFTINKANAVVVTAPKAVSGLVYTGQPQTLITAGSANGGKMMYSLNGTTYSTALPKGTDAEQYIVYYKVVGDANHKNVSARSITVTIGNPSITLDEVDDNSETLELLDGHKANVTLTRTLQSGEWNTFAVPFDIDAATLTSLGISTVKELGSASFKDGVLTLNYVDATTIEAGKPYLVKVDVAVQNPVFSSVTVSEDLVPIVTDVVDCIPTFGKTLVKGPSGEEDNANTVLFLAAGNKLLNLSVLPADIKGFRAYFQLKGVAVSARSFRLNFDDATAIDHSPFSIDHSDGDIYNLQGRKMVHGTLSNGTLPKGVYIVDGKKVIIK